MITGLSLQNRLRTYRKKKRKNNVRAFFSQSGLETPSPPPATPDEKFLDPRVDIRYRGGIETISLLKTFYCIVLPRSNDHVYICLFVNIEIKTVGWHIQQSGVVLKTV